MTRRTHRSSSKPQIETASEAVAARPFAPDQPPQPHDLGRLTVQTKLTLGAENDPAEREADRIAEAVTSASPEGVQRQAEVTPNGSSAGSAIDPGTERAIQQARSGGSALPGPTREHMGAAFGADFSGVRVHTGTQADGLNRSLNARAFTTGSDIFFRQGEYSPGSGEGQRLLAHELTHVVQQGGGRLAVQRRKGEQNQQQAIDWSSATAAVPSSEGALGGVVFVTVGSQTHVIKPGTGSAANALFAEEVLETIGNAQTTESRPVLSGTPEYDALKAALTHFKSDPNSPHADRWAQNFPHYERAPFFLVQKSMKSPELGTSKQPASNNAEFSDVYKTDPLRILQDAQYLYNLGRLIVADTLLGNADRLEALNGGNFFVLGNGKVGAIDNEAFFPSLRVVEREYGSMRGREDASNEDFWINHLISGGLGLTKSAPVSSVDVVMRGIDSWIRSTFAASFFKKPDFKAIKDSQERLQAEQAYQQRVQILEQHGYHDTSDSATAAANFKSKAWQTVRTAILNGYNDGLKALHDNLIKRDGELRAAFYKLQAQYGVDSENMDPAALEVRATYMLERADGKSEKKAHDAAKERGLNPLTEKTKRVLSNSVLTKDEVTRLTQLLGQLNADEQDAMVSITNWMQKNITNRKQADALERQRATLLKEFLQSYEAETNGQVLLVVRSRAYQSTVARAKTLKSSSDKTEQNLPIVN